MKDKDQNCRKKTQGSDALPVSLCVHNGRLCLKEKEKERRRRDCEIICVKHQSVIHSSHFLNALSENYEVVLLFLLFR